MMYGNINNNFIIASRAYFLQYIPTEMIFSDYRLGCTYLRKLFSRITVWDVHTNGNDWVSMPRPIAHGPSLCPRRAYPRQFLGRVGRTPYRPHSLGDGSKCRRGKGLKTVCIAPTRTSVTPIVCERRVYHTRSSRGASKRRTFATVHT